MGDYLIDGRGNAYAMKVNSDGSINITSNDDGHLDAFGRQRVSEPYTIFDSKNIFNNPDIADSEENQPLYYDNQEVSGSGTSTTYNVNQASNTLSVSLNTAGKRVRQSKRRFNYQPGKSQLAFLTFNMNGRISNVVKQEGLFDDENGLFLELSDDVYFVRRTFTSGSKEDIKVKQSDWNLDKFDGTGSSGITINFSKTQIFIIDYEWLGVGRVRMGFVIDGKIYYAHQFLNTNILDVVYMSTPNLPIRTSIENLGTGAQTGITQICSTIISEGGVQETGEIRYISTTNGLAFAGTNTYPLVALRLRNSYLGLTVRELNSSIISTGNDNFEWQIVLNPSISGASGTVNWNAVQYAGVEAFVNVSGSTLSGGVLLNGGFSLSNLTSNNVLNNAITIGANINGSRDIIVLAVRPLTTNGNFYGGLTWRELS